MLVVQGALTLGAGLFEDVLRGEALSAMTSTGGALIIGISLKLLDLKDVKGGSATSCPRSCSRRCSSGSSACCEARRAQRAVPFSETMSRRKPGARISLIGFSGEVGST